MYPSCVTHLSTHSSVPPSIHPPPRPSISVYIHSSTCPFILTSLHPSTYQSIYLYLQQMMFWASPSTRSWAGYCCCRDKLTLIWLHRNRCLNRHLNYTINNRDLDTVFWEHHGGGRDRQRRWQPLVIYPEGSCIGPSFSRPWTYDSLPCHGGSRTPWITRTPLNPFYRCKTEAWSVA